jgi:hypothetical protein
VITWCVVILLFCDYMVNVYIEGSLKKSTSYIIRDFFYYMVMDCLDAKHFLEEAPT